MTQIHNAFPEGKHAYKNNGNHSKVIEWDKWLQQCGDGELQNIEGTDDYITLKQEMCSEIDDKQRGKSIQDSIFFTYGDINTQSARPQWAEFASERAILASRHEEVNRINKQCSNVYSICLANNLSFPASTLQSI